MKKILLGTTALAAVSLAASSASAQSLEERIRALEESMLMGTPGSGWDVQVTGYLVGGFFITNHDEEPNEDLASTNIRWGGGEIQFRMSTVLDNGMEVGGRVELEDVTTGDQIDETYIYASGGFGRMVFGADDSASNLMHYSTPWFGVQGVNSPNWRHIATTAVKTGTNTGISGDANKITYFTPRFSGFQFGISYVPDNSKGGGGGGGAKRDRSNEHLHDIVSVGANFQRDLGGFTMGVSGGYETGSQEGWKDDPVHWNLGSQLSAMGFTIGGGYYNAEGFTDGAGKNAAYTCANIDAMGDDPAMANISTGYYGPPSAVGTCALEGEEIPTADLSDVIEKNVWSVGVKYETGPWSFSTGYMKAQGEKFPGLTQVAGTETPDTGDDTYIVEGKLKPEDSALAFGATYAVGPGVTLGADLGFFETENGAGGSIEGTGGGLILGISF